MFPGPSSLHSSSAALGPGKACEVVLPHLCSFHRRLYRSAILQSCLPHLKTPTETPRAAGPFSPTPGLRGFPQGKKHQGGNSGIYFPPSVGQSWNRHRVLPHPAVRCQHPHHSLPSFLLSICKNPCALGKGATVLILDRLPRDYSGLSVGGWSET